MKDITFDQLCTEDAEVTQLNEIDLDSVSGGHNWVTYVEVATAIVSAALIVRNSKTWHAVQMTILAIGGLLLLSALMDGHSTYLALSKGYREGNVFFSNLQPKGVYRLTVRTLAVFMTVLMLHIGLQVSGFLTYDYKFVEWVMLSIGIGKTLAAIENYILVFSGVSISNTIFAPAYRNFGCRAAIDFISTLLITALPAVHIAAFFVY